MNALLSLLTVPDNKPSLDLEDLSRQLKNIDESSIAELVAFKRSLESKLQLYEPSNPWIAARSLTRAQVLSSFGLKHNIDSEGHVDFPEFTPSELPGARSEWLARSLNLGVDIFRRKNADTTIIINLIIMDVIHDLPEFQIADHFKPGNTPTPRPPSIVVYRPGEPPAPTPPKRLKIRTYSNISLSSTIKVAEKDMRVVGQLDAGFSIGNLMPGRSTHSVYFTDTYLVVLNFKHDKRSWGWGWKMNEQINELIAYLSMIHQGRAYWLKEANRVGGDNKAYGLLSDGDVCVFIFLDKSLTVHMSPVLQIKYDLLEVLQYLRHCFTGIVNSPPTTLPPSLQAMADALRSVS